MGRTAVLLLTGVLLLAAYAYSITARLTAVETYIAERGQVRDEQAADIREQLRQAVCDVLDRLHPTPLLSIPSAPNTAADLAHLRRIYRDPTVLAGLGRARW